MSRAEESLIDLRDRLVNRTASLVDMVERQTNDHERSRLRGKVEGMRLALSYVDEHIRELDDDA